MPFRTSLERSVPAWVGWVTIDPEGERPLYEQIASVLRGRILEGELLPGRPLPSEQAIKQEFGVSRGTARKAAGLLAADGLIRMSPGRGHYVVPEEERPP